ncbi:superinfection immunity protein [Chloroflexota bacterium]
MPVIDFFFSGIIGIFVFILSLAFYFLPTIIALIRKQPNTLAIFLLNFFLGWTFIGWVVSLIWAVAK